LEIKKGDIAVIWLQEGIANDEARRLAEKNGIIFVQDTCMLKEHKLLFSKGN
jgi:predicted CoA-binding protein